MLHTLTEANFAKTILEVRHVYRVWGCYLRSKLRKSKNPSVNPFAHIWTRCLQNLSLIQRTVAHLRGFEQARVDAKYGKIPCTQHGVAHVTWTKMAPTCFCTSTILALNLLPTWTNNSITGALADLICHCQLSAFSLPPFSSCLVPDWLRACRWDAYFQMMNFPLRAPGKCLQQGHETKD